MSRDNVCFHASYQKMLRLYGFDEPDTALTYPCTGFVPYSPPPTSSAPSTTETVITSSGAENKTSASPTDEVVTELTQTSQTVTVRNNLTNLPTIEAATPGSAQFETRTQTESILNTFENTAATTFADESITAAYSNTISAVPAKGKEAALDGNLPPLEMAETNTKSTTTIKVEKLNSTVSPQSNTNNETSTAKTDVYFSTTTDPSNQNFTVTFTDFTFPTTDASQSFLSDSTTSLPETSTVFSATLGFSLDNNLNFTLPTLAPLFNDTSAGDFELTTFTPFTSPFSSSFETTDFGNSSTFFNTLVNFIDGTTQTVKDLIGFGGENSTGLESTTLPSVPITTPEKADPSAVSQNTTSSAANTTTALNAAFRSPQLKLDNASNVDPRILPKKSISESNENLSRSANIAAESKAVQSTFRTPPNFVNVLSVKHSKTVSSKYDIRSRKGSNRRVIRNVPPIGLPSGQGYNNTAEIVGNFTETLRKLRDDSQNVTTKLQDSSRPGSNFSSYSVSIKAESEGRVPLVAHPTTVYADINNFNGDMRSVRSYGHNSQHSLNADWFATPDQNIIRVPVFSYSAILPFAYIEDIKSKVIEIPLDDYNYSLLLILPTPELSIHNLLTSLTRLPLRRIWSLLRPTAVYASIPKFSIISHVNLRNALYTLGIRDIFHRYRADLSLMSPDSKLYVRSIEQVVTVYVDKFPSSVYPIPEKYTERHFIASHPFLYFVLDRDSGVSLVAGILSNPSKHII